MKLFYFEYTIGTMPHDKFFSAVISGFNKIEDAKRSLVSKVGREYSGSVPFFTKENEIDSTKPHYIIIPR